MNLYTTDYKIKSFKSAEEILNEFYNWRITFYGKRKELILKKIKDEINHLSNQIKFIDIVIKDNGKIFKLEENEINKYLEKNKIGKVNNNYDYLVNMTFKQLTKTNLEKLEKKLKENKSEYKKIEDISDKQFWLKDLEELEKVI